MPGLNPLMNAQPRHQIPNEAPSYFSPFFEQPAKPAPVAIWQPPTIESSLRSKAAPNIPRTPVEIPTAGTWSHINRESEESKRGLFQPKPKKPSADEMMWLGSVSGFQLPNPSLESDKTYVKTKLVRKPEEKASQASALTGPKAAEEKKKKEDEAKARERRLEEWSTKKKQRAAEKKANESRGGYELPQPEESSSSSNRPYAPRSISGIRPKVFQMLPQPVETTSNRPNATHRPNYPNSEISFAPSNPILPQPVETIRRSNRSQKIHKEKVTDEMVWMGLPQPVETVRRSNRKSPLSRVQSSDRHPSKPDHDDARTTADPDAVDSLLPQPIESVKRSNRTPKEQKTVILPQPIESTKRSNRPVDQDATKEPLPAPIESSQRSNRPTTKEILPEPIETTRKSNRSPPRELLPEPVETTRKSNRPTPKEVLPEPIESTKRSNRPPAKEILPEPIETTKKSNRPTAKEILPEPIETTRKSNRPTAEPILPQPIETTKKSNRPEAAKPLPKSAEEPKQKNPPTAEAEAQKEILPLPTETTKRSNRPTKNEEILPQPIESVKRTNRPSASVLQKALKPQPPTPTTSFFGPDFPFPQVEAPPRRPMQVRPLIAQPIETSMRTTRAKVLPPEPRDLPVPASASKVERWNNRTPIARHPRRRSTIFQAKKAAQHRPRNRGGLSGQTKRNWTRPEDHVEHLHEPIDSQPGSPEGTPPSSKCPSLSSSPSSSDSSAWDVSKGAKEPAMREPGDSGDGGFAAYVLSIEKALREKGAVGTPARIKERQKEEPHYPFPEVGRDAAQKSNLSTGDTDTVSTRSDTTDTLRPKLRAVTSDPGGSQEQPPNDDYPICHSPVHENFKRPELWNLSGPAEEVKERQRESNSSRLLTDDFQGSQGFAIRVDEPIQLPTPPDSDASSGSHKIVIRDGLASAPPRMFYQALSPSPGYTVASRPPAAQKDADEADEVTQQFVDEVYGYLSLGFDSIARKFDQELGDYTGLTVDEVRQDRKRAVARYCRRWVKDNPHIATGETAKGGLW